jgi:hypothetical protein
MSFPDCDIRTDPKNRIGLISRFKIEPLLISELPDKKIHTGCCGPIKTWVYTFSYKENSNPSNDGLFYTGKGCGEDFILLLNAQRPRSFSFKSSTQTRKSSTTIGTSSKFTKNFTSLNKEAYNSLHILIIEYGSIDNAIKSLLEILLSKPDEDLSDGAIKYLNGVVKKRTNSTLSTVITAMQNKHTNFRSFSFPLINSCLTRQGQVSNF